ncbi:MAG TPA: hypothetical protein VFW47_02930 [Phenylobacterium sp.]|nr:hypothetical protein [Phenylobacterium sp.]
MDRRRPRAQELGFAAALLLTAGALAQAGDRPLRAERWLAPGTDIARTLSREPAECLRLPDEPDRRLSVEVGRAAFRAPTVLGGQAARAGLACESCHRAGRANPEFAFPGVSGPPGTADVTSSLFSTHRGDGVFNPRPIPDLGGPKTGLRIDQAPQAKALEPFIRGLVTQEFDGAEPPAAVLQGLADYVRALSPDACPRGSDAPVSLAGLMADARRAAQAAEALDARGDRPSAVVMVQAARARLFFVDERYADPTLAADRDRLRAADGALAAIAQALRDGTPDAARRLARWRSDSRRLEAALARHQARSLFDSRRLAAATDGGLPRRPS